MKTLGETLALYRKKAGYSQIDVAAMLTKNNYPIKNKGISAWEKGLAHPNATQFLLLCKMYGITDIYSAFLEPNPDNPLSVLNSEGKEKALDFIVHPHEKIDVKTDDLFQIIIDNLYDLAQNGK